MDKDKKIFIGILLLLLMFMIFVGILSFKDKKVENVANTDAINFKNEYESLNNVVRAKDGKTIREISIDANNPVDILTEEEAVSFLEGKLENKTGLLYFGFPDCPWCRSMLPVLLTTLNNMSISRLYYLNVGSIRDTLALGEKNKVEVKEEGTKGYYRLLELLDDVLDPYYLTNADGKKINTKEKRIFAPTVIAVKDGKVVDIHVGTVESQESGYDPLTQEQQEELAERFATMVRKVYNVDCDEPC